MKRVRFALLAAALAACSNDTRMGIEFHGPVAMAVFNGYTHVRPGKRSPYLAVCNSSTDELRIVDLVNHSAVPSPGMAFPLSVPTDSNPFKVASASLGDGGADLLVVMISGALSLQVVSTWDQTLGSMQVVQQVDLAAALGSANAGVRPHSLLGLPLTAGKARLLVGMSSQKLAVVDFIRAADGSIIPDPASPIQVQSLGFDPLDLAYDSQDPVTVYSATADLITDTDTNTGFSTFGVAGINTQSWKIRAYKTGPADSQGAPTRLVAAARVGERYADNPEHFKAPVSRVYAVLAESESVDERSPGSITSWGCGLNHPISCGIVTIDPSLNPTPAPVGHGTSLADDLAAGLSSPAAGSVPVQSYRAPWVLPGRPEAIAIALPPQNPSSQRCTPGSDNSDPNCKSAGIAVEEASTPFLRLAPGSGERWTTAAMVVGTNDDQSYVIDLGRMAVANDVLLLNDVNHRTRVMNAFSILPNGAGPKEAEAGLGLYTDVSGGGTPTVTIDPAAMAANVVVAPGYTPDDTWTITYHGALPGLVNREATLANDGTNIWVALQVPAQSTGGAPIVWETLGNIADPALGVRVGDYVDLVLANPLPPPIPAGTCADAVNSTGNGQGRGVVKEILAPSATHPGGALKIRSLADDPADPEITPDGLGTFCVGQIPAGTAEAPTVWPVTLTVRAAGLVLAGVKSGYAGRPELDSTAPFQFQWAEESSFLGADACPDTPELDHQRAWIDDPTNHPNSRSQCETLSVVRKARRFYYPAELCDPGEPCQVNNWYPNFIKVGDSGNALTTGPALQLRVGRFPAMAVHLTIGASISFTTLSGFRPMSRVPTSTTTPRSALSYDRSQIPAELNSSAANEGTVFYVTFLGDVLMEFPPGASLTSVLTLH